MRDPIKTSATESDSLAGHLEHLAADADDLQAMLGRQHSEEGEIHLEALGASERLATSLRKVIDALRHHEPLAMDSSDVWKLLNRDHTEGGEGIVR